MQMSLAKKIFAVSSAAAMVLAAMPFGASAAVHSAGANVVSNGTVYFINASGQKQPYTSAGAFLSYGFNSWSNVMPASAEDLALPTGAFVPAMDGSLINDHGTVYLITNGQKAGFTSASNFLGLGYSWSNVIPGDVSFMSSGSLVSSTAMAHPAGTLVNDHGTVYLMSSTGKMGIPSLSVFNSWGYKWTSVVPANSYDSAVAMSNGVMMAMVPGQLSPLGSSTTGTTTGAVNVSVASNTPAAGSIAKSAKVTFTRLNVTAGPNGGQVNSMVVTRLGLSSDSDVSNVYLFDDASGTQLSVGSFNLGKVTFTGSPLFTVPANSSKMLSVRADMASGATTGDSIGYGVLAASDVNANGATVGGTFPANGNLMTVAAVSNLGALTITSTGGQLPTTMNPGQTQVNVGYFQFAGSNQPLSVSSIKLTNVGSIAAGNIQNLNLFNSTTQVGNTQQLGSDNTVTFNLASSPLVIPSGQTVTLWLKGDVMGGSTRTFQFTIQRTSDVSATDTTYNTGIVPGLATATGTSPVPSSTNNQVTINAGSATMAVDSASPTGNIATGASGVLLGTFDFTAAGEDVRVSAITTTETSANISGGATTDYLTNGKLVDVTSSGSPVQVGSSANLMLNTSANGAVTTSFSIPGYWTIPAGTTRKLAVYADTKAGTATASQLSNSSTGTVSVGITSVTAQGASSLQTVSFGTSTARTLTFTSSSLTAALNASLASTTSTNPSGVGGQTGVKVGSFTLTAGSSEAVSISSLQITTGTSGNGFASTKFQNLSVKVNGTQVGTPQGVLAANTAYTFNPSTTLSIPAGNAATVDVYADLVNGAASGTVTSAVNLSAVTASGAISNNSVTATGLTVAGQNVYIATSGSLVNSTDSQTPTAAQIQQLPMGMPQQTLFVMNEAAGTPEPVSIQTIKITDTETSGAQGDLSNFKLYVNGAQVGPTVPSESGSGTTGTITFNMQSNPINVPAGQNISIYVKADISAFPNATSGNSHTLNLAAATDVTAIGGISGASLTPTGTSTANAGIIYKTALTLAKDATSPSGSSSASANQTLAVMNVSNASNAANAQATFMPACAATSTGFKLQLSSTAVPSTTARVLNIYKASDLTTAVATVTLTPTAATGTWTTLLTWTCTNTTQSIASSTANLVASLGSWTPQVINSGATVQYVVQFDTTDATSQKSFAVSVPTSQGSRAWYDSSAYVGTFMGTPVTFGTLTY